MELKGQGDWVHSSIHRGETIVRSSIERAKLHSSSTVTTSFLDDGLEGLLAFEVSDINSSRSDFRLGVRFCTIGMVVALLEEFISQGVLKHTLFGWVIPAFIAFVPFLGTSALIYRFLRKKIKKKSHLELFYYMISGGIGLFVEWFIIGLSPWGSSSGTNPVLVVVFQLGLFSFWGSVAFAPRILVDRRTVVIGLVRWFKRFVAIGFVIIYLATFAANRQSQFATGIISILTIFLALNIFYIRYIRSWGPVVPA